MDFQNSILESDIISSQTQPELSSQQHFQFQSEYYVSSRVPLDWSFLLTATGNLAQIKINLMFDLIFNFH